MTRKEAVSEAVSKVTESGFTFDVLRRGDAYRVQMTAYGAPRGWKVAEMIGPGNVQNY